MRKWGLTLLAVFFTIILTACNQNDSKDEDKKEEDKKETSEKTSQKKEASQSENEEGFKALKEKEHNSQRNKKLLMIVLTIKLLIIQINKKLLCYSSNLD